MDVGECYWAPYTYNGPTGPVQRRKLRVYDGRGTGLRLVEFYFDGIGYLGGNPVDGEFGWYYTTEPRYSLILGAIGTAFCMGPYMGVNPLGGPWSGVAGEIVLGFDATDQRGNLILCAGGDQWRVWPRTTNRSPL